MSRRALLFVLLAPAIAHADPKADAQVHIDKATQLFEAGKSADAIVHLTDAYALDPRPELLYALGQAHASLGQCATAKTFYDKFAEAQPDDAILARDAAKACKDAPPPPVVKPPPPVEPPPPPPPQRAHRQWHGDTLGLAIAGAGLVLVGVGAYELSASHDAHDEAVSQPTYDAFLDRLDDAESKRKLAIGMFAIGGAAVAAGIVHLVLHTRTETVGVTPMKGGGGVSWSHRF